jgi:putative SOS response-associated peptidase YedK
MTVLVKHFELGLEAARQLALFEPRYNIAPTQEILAVRMDAEKGEREAAMLRWGLIPSWSKEAQEGLPDMGGPPMINARGETIAEKPSFRSAFRRRRCLIPADGFYEWQKSAGSTGLKSGRKQPYYIHYRDDRPFAFAGLWETWRAKDAAAKDAAKGAESAGALTLESCTIVTTSATKALAAIHDRMPVILEPADYALWLDPAVQDPAAVQQLVAPNDDPAIVAEPVSTHVNRVANDDPRCVEVERALFD